MIAAARAAGERHVELQARNWRVTDLFELGDMPACREEMARHARLADELRLPSFQWYTPLWAAVEAVLAGRFAEAERLTAEAREAGVRAGDRNAELFAGMVDVRRADRARRRSTRSTWRFIEDKIANSPAGPAYASSYAWVLAGRGESRAGARGARRRDRPPARLRRQLAVRPGRVPPRRASRSATHATRPSSTSASRPTPGARRRPAARCELRRGRPPPRRPRRRCSAATTTPCATCAPRSRATTSSAAPCGGARRAVAARARAAVAAPYTRATARRYSLGTRKRAVAGDVRSPR